MGRHSAPDDDDAAVDDPGAGASGDPVGPATLLLEAPHPGRHSVAAPDGTRDAGADTQVLGRVDAGAPEPSGGVADGSVGVQAPEVAPAPRQRRADDPRSTAADLALVRTHRDLRARCAAAVLAPFIVYVVVLLALGAAGRTYLLFVFIPLIVAGLLVGAILDAAHRKLDRVPAETPADPATSTPDRSGDAR